MTYIVLTSFIAVGSWSDLVSNANNLIITSNGVDYSLSLELRRGSSWTLMLLASLAIVSCTFSLVGLKIKKRDTLDQPLIYST